MKWIHVGTSGIGRSVASISGSYGATRRLLLLSYAIFALLLLSGYVVAPHNNRPEVGDAGSPTDGYHTNRILSDQTVFYLPVLDDQLAAPVFGDGWLKSWNPHNECGAPRSPSCGVSKVYFLANLCCFVFRDAYQAYSWITLVTLCLMALFTFSFAEELELHPAACYVSAMTLSWGAFCIFWLPQLVFLSSLCWTMGLYWLVTAYARRCSGWSLVGIAFCVYSLLVAGYPVLIILFGYVLAPYTVMALAAQCREIQRTLSMAGGILVAVLVGAVAALPVYLDIYHAASESARSSGASDAFLLAVYPKFTSMSDGLMFVASSLDPSALGGPNALPYPQCANGILLSPLVVLLVAIAIAIVGLRPTLGCLMRFWLIAIVVFYILNCWSGAYLFTAHHLGLSMSRCRTCWGALIPVCMVSGMAVDFVLRQGVTRRFPMRRLWFGLVAGIAALCALYISLQLCGMHPAHRAIVAAVIIASALALCIRTRSPLGIMLVTTATLLAYGSSTILLRPLSTICRRSPLTDALRETSDGSCRYACVSPMTALPPNEEGLFGLCSIHCYDPLLSRRFGRFVERLSKAKVAGEGRVFRLLDRDSLADRGESLSLAGVKYLVTKEPLVLPWIELSGKVDCYFIYKNRLPLRMRFQTDAFKLDDSKAARLSGDAKADSWPVDCVANSNDRIRLSTTAMESESLLFLSQQFHDYWQASGGGKPLKTVVVNDFYQGVILPAGTAHVDLRFLPWTRWSWIPQAAFAVLGLAYLTTRQLATLTKV